MKKSEGIKIGLFLLILVIGITVAYNLIVDSKKLPIYNPSDLNKKLVDVSLQNVTKQHKVGSFELMDQNGNTVTEKDLEGTIYVADFFFTTCQSICPKMSKQMERVQEEFLDDGDIKFISHSVTPELDSVEVLKQYADQYGAVSAKWYLTTGSKQMIYDLARKSYFAVMTEGDGGKEDFIHTENFVLVDKDKRLRGFYDGTSTKDVDKLIDDIKTLKREYDN